MLKKKERGVRASIAPEPRGQRPEAPDTAFRNYLSASL